MITRPPSVRGEPVTDRSGHAESMARSFDTRRCFAFINVAPPHGFPVDVPSLDSAWVQGHTLKEFIRRLKARFQNEVHHSDDDEDDGVDPSAFNWGALGTSVSGHFRGAPAITCMLGPLDSQAKAKRVIVRQVRQKLGSEVKPQEIQAKPPPLFQSGGCCCYVVLLASHAGGSR